MIIDTSAVLAILMREPDAIRFADAISHAWPRRMSVANLLEAVIVVEGRGGPAAGRELDALLERAGVEFVPVTSMHASAARQAWRRFGKGNHAAALNFRGLRCVCAGEVDWRAAAVEGKRLRAYRHRGGMSGIPGCPQTETPYGRWRAVEEDRA